MYRNLLNKHTPSLSVFFFPDVEMWVCQSHIKATHPSVNSIYSFQVLKSSNAFLLRQSWSCSAVRVVWRSRLCSGPLVSTELKHTWKEGKFCRCHISQQRGNCPKQKRLVSTKVMDHVSLLTHTQALYIKTATKTTEEPFTRSAESFQTHSYH